jgi:hypothetical protein
MGKLPLESHEGTAMDIATAALIVSVTLAGLRVYEFFQDRRARLKVLVLLTSDPITGNTITLLNSSKVPANIYYFTLVWVQPGRLQRYCRFLRKVESEESPMDYQHCNITVPPHSQHALEFSEVDHFNWGHTLKSDIYLKVWLVGWRYPKWFFVTGPKK